MLTGSFGRLVGCIIIIAAICLPVSALSGNLAGETVNMTIHLAGLRSHIEEKSAAGVDTSEAETCYNIAGDLLASVKDRPAGRESSVMDDLVSAQASIDAGELALDKAWAEQYIADARVPLDNAMHIISIIGASPSLVNTPQYRQILTQNATATALLAAAGDEAARGNYSGSRALAEKAWQAGNDTYTDAMALVPKQTTGPEPPLVMLKLALSDARVLAISIIAGAVLVIGVVIILMKRKETRD